MARGRQALDPASTQTSGMPWSTRAMSVPGSTRRSKSNLRKKSVQEPVNSDLDYYALTG